MTTLHVRRAIQGNGESLGWIFERFTPFVEAQVRMRLGVAAGRSEVEDIVADTWVVTLQKLRQLTPRDGRFAPVLLRFLGTTAVRICNSQLRRMIQARKREAPPADGASAPDPLADLARQTLGVATRIGRNETVDAVRGALESLDDDKRTLLILRLVEGRTNQEIAELLRQKRNTIAVRYRRALEALRSALPKQVLRDILGM